MLFFGVLDEKIQGKMRVSLTMIFVYIKAVNVLTRLDRSDLNACTPSAHAFKKHAGKAKISNFMGLQS